MLRNCRYDTNYRAKTAGTKNESGSTLIGSKMPKRGNESATSRNSNLSFARLTFARLVWICVTAPGQPTCVWVGVSSRSCDVVVRSAASCGLVRYHLFKTEKLNRTKNGWRKHVCTMGQQHFHEHSTKPQICPVVFVKWSKHGTHGLLSLKDVRSPDLLE